MLTIFNTSDYQTVPIQPKFSYNGVTQASELDININNKIISDEFIRFIRGTHRERLGDKTMSSNERII